MPTPFDNLLSGGFARPMTVTTPPAPTTGRSAPPLTTNDTGQLGEHQTGATNLTGPIFGIRSSPIADAGLQTLFQILMGQGATDPALLNRELADIGHSTNAAQQAAAGRSAAGGTQGSGITEAIQAAIDVGGSDIRADRLAQESQIQEQRMRDDLMLLLRLFIDPSIQGQALASGQFNQQQARSDQREAARNSFLGDIFGTGVSAFTGGLL